MATKFSGADWLESVGGKALSPFGKQVADLLGQAYSGIYHISREVMNTRAKWDDDRHIEIVIWSDLSTYDFDMLTKLVVLAHDYAIRFTIEPASNKHLRLVFHRRERKGDNSRRHPTMEEAVENIRERIGVVTVDSSIFATSDAPLNASAQQPS